MRFCHERRSLALFAGSRLLLCVVVGVARSEPSNMKAAVVSRHGGPEVLAFEHRPVPLPGPGQARVRVAAAGVNFIDIYFRSGDYPSQLPYIPGLEGAGVVDAAGPGAEEWIGRRVAFMHKGAGAYAEYAVLPAARLVPMDGALTFVQGAAAMLQGMTAHYLVTDVVPGLKPGDAVLVHAAAGGTGRLVVQVAKLKGLRVIATTSSEAKAAVARAAGADHVIVHSAANFVDEAMKLTAGEGVAAVFDGVGQATFLPSFDCLRRRGSMVLFGAASGNPAPVDPKRVAKGSVYLTRPTLFDYVAEDQELQRRALEVLGWVKDGALKLEVHSFPLGQAAGVQEKLGSGQTTGKLVLEIDAPQSEL